MIKGEVRRVAIIVLILFLLAGAFLAIKPGWKEYKGDGFSIKYPPSWTILREAEKSPTVNKNYTVQELLVIGSLNEKYYNESYQHLTLSVYRIPKDTLKISIRDLAKDFWLPSEECCSSSEQVDNIALANNKALADSFSSYSNGIWTKHTLYFIEESQNLYVVETTLWIKESQILKVYSEVIQKLITDTLSISK